MRVGAGWCGLLKPALHSRYSLHYGGGDGGGDGGRGIGGGGLGGGGLGGREGVLVLIRQVLIVYHSEEYLLNRVRLQHSYSCCQN